MKLARSFVAIMAIASLTACGDDDDSDDIELAGVYTVSSFTYTADEGGQSVDLASIGAASGGPYGILTMTVAEDNSFSGSLKLPTAGGPQTFPIGGDITLSGDDDIRIDFNAATQALGVLDPFEEGTFDFEDETLTIELPNVTFDFGALAGTPTGDVDADLLIVGSRS